MYCQEVYSSLSQGFPFYAGAGSSHVDRAVPRCGRGRTREVWMVDVPPTSLVGRPPPCDDPLPSPMPTTSPSLEVVSYARVPSGWASHRLGSCSHRKRKRGARPTLMPSSSCYWPASNSCCPSNFYVPRYTNRGGRIGEPSNRGNEASLVPGKVNETTTVSPLTASQVSVPTR